MNISVVLLFAVFRFSAKPAFPTHKVEDLSQILGYGKAEVLEHNNLKMRKVIRTEAALAGLWQSGIKLSRVSLISHRLRPSS